MYKRLTVLIECGDRTCRRPGGDRCRFVRSGLKQEYSCHLFEKSLMDNEAGMLARLPECLALHRASSTREFIAIVRNVFAEQFDGSAECAERLSLKKPRTTIRAQYVLSDDNDIPVFTGDWVVTSLEGTRTVIGQDEFKQRYAGVS